MASYCVFTSSSGTHRKRSNHRIEMKSCEGSPKTKAIDLVKGELSLNLESLELAGDLFFPGQDPDSRLRDKMKRISGLSGSFRANLIQSPSLHEETDHGPTVSKLKRPE